MEVIGCGVIDERTPGKPYQGSSSLSSVVVSASSSPLFSPSYLARMHLVHINKPPAALTDGHRLSDHLICSWLHTLARAQKSTPANQYATPSSSPTLAATPRPFNPSSLLSSPTSTSPAHQQYSASPDTQAPAPRRARTRSTRTASPSPFRRSAQRACRAASDRTA